MLSDISCQLSQNKLLTAIPREVYQRIMPELEHVSLSLGEVVYESGERMEHIYFPTTCIISLVYTLENGSTAEMGVVGNDGVVGIAIFMGGGKTPNQGVVLGAGGALRMRAKSLLEEFNLGGSLQLCLLRYTQALITQISHTAICNRYHSLEPRLCRWLLLMHDRIRTNEIRMTQELIAIMLGSRREGVNVAAGRLQDEGVIRYSRGNITILDRSKLEACACECYQVVRDESERLLSQRFR